MGRHEKWSSRNSHNILLSWKKIYRRILKIDSKIVRQEDNGYKSIYKSECALEYFIIYKKANNKLDEYSICYMD